MRILVMSISMKEKVLKEENDVLATDRHEEGVRNGNISHKTRAIRSRFVRCT